MQNKLQFYYQTRKRLPPLSASLVARCVGTDNEKKDNSCCTFPHIYMAGEIVVTEPNQMSLFLLPPILLPPILDSCHITRNMLHLSKVIFIRPYKTAHIASKECNIMTGVNQVHETCCSDVSGFSFASSTALSRPVRPSTVSVHTSRRVVIASTICFKCFGALQMILLTIVSSNFSPKVARVATIPLRHNNKSLMLLPSLNAARSNNHRRFYIVVFFTRSSRHPRQTSL
jgi:hypothetical protein